MPTIFASGSPNADGYLSGVLCSTVSDLLSNIRDTLVSAGWTVDDSQIAGGNIECVGTDGSDNCWVNFFVSNVSVAEYLLHVQGDLDGTGQTLSPDFVTVPFKEGGLARLYLAADQAAGCILVLNGSAGGQSAHFGFLNRITNNPHSWMIGKLDRFLDTAYIARDIYNVDWSQMNRYTQFWNSTSYLTGGFQHLWDSYTVDHNFYSSYASTDNRNSGYYAWRGAVDSVTGLPILSDYGYIIGRNVNNSYVNANKIPNAFHFPGRVRFARTGLCSVDAGDQFKVENDTKTVISGGAIGEYQGFVIADTAV